MKVVVEEAAATVTAERTILGRDEVRGCEDGNGKKRRVPKLQRIKCQTNYWASLKVSLFWICSSRFDCLPSNGRLSNDSSQDVYLGCGKGAPGRDYSKRGATPHSNIVGYHFATHGFESLT